MVGCADVVVRDTEWCSIKSTTPVSPGCVLTCTLLKRTGASLRGVGRDSGTWGCGSLCDAAVRGSSWPPRRDLIFSLLPPGGSNTFFFLFACEGVLSRGPASLQQEAAGWDAPWDPWYSGPSQMSPIPRVLLRLCISFASEAP